MTYIIVAQVNIDATCAWALLHLLRNPDHLAAFEAEVQANPPTIDGIYPIKNMPFSEACLRETGRLYNNSVMLRYAQHDIQTPSGIVIPRGWIATSPVTVQMDPELYDEPGKWNPRRFLPAPSDDATEGGGGRGGDLYATRFRNYEFVQFGGGKHVCSGEKLTHSLLRASIWPALLDNYQLEVVQDSLVDGQGIDGVGIMPNHAENLGTAFGVTEPYVKVTKRDVPLSSAVHSNQ
jgi:sterol 14-demethylase